MPRYFFNLLDGVEVHDSEGVELASLDLVRSEALKGARDIMANDIKEGHLILDEAIVVTDEEGREVHRQAFADAVRIEGGQANR